MYEVSTGAEGARRGRGRWPAKHLKNVKIWVDDRRGTYPKMTPEVYNAVIDEAHAHRMMVHAHAIALADQKAVVRAGADVLVHTVANEKLDDECIALLREKKPYWTTVIGLGDRSEVCDAIRSSIGATPPGARGDSGESCGPQPANAAARSDRSPTTCRRWSRPARVSCSGPTPASPRVTRSAGPITTRSRDGWSSG